MITQCDNSQVGNLLEYIGKDYPKCLYLYIDMQKYGSSSAITQTFAVKKDGIIRAIMLAYHSALHIYSRDLDFEVREMIAFINRWAPSIICASTEIIKMLEQPLSQSGYESEFGHIGRLRKPVLHNSQYVVSLAVITDVNEIASLLYADDDIGASYTMDDLIIQMKERLTDGFVRSYVIKSHDGHVIAHLGTGAEIDNLCTVCYVITDPHHRRKGLSSALFSYACEKLESEGKEIYSVYYPENSRQLHHKMGFEDCCEIGKLFKSIE